MINEKIINEFNKLINKINKDKKNITDKKELTTNNFRLKQIINAYETIKKYPYEITYENIKEFSELPGIGKGTIQRIKEILENGFLKEVKDYKEDENKSKIIENLLSIVGVGQATALQLYNLGITSVEDLKYKIDNELIEVNDKIKLGVDYYGKFKGDIPRKEITSIYKIFTKIIKKLNKKLDEDEQYIFEFCGSYRREKLVSGDIDILITKKKNIGDINHLKIIIDELKKPNKYNLNKPLIVDDMTINYETKYMGFLKYLDNYARRIDVRFVEYNSYYSALLYFTGSAELNKKMRQIAKKLNYKLSEYGLFKNNEPIPIESEEDIFKLLNMEYIEPKLR